MCSSDLTTHVVATHGRVFSLLLLVQSILPRMRERLRMGVTSVTVLRVSAHTHTDRDADADRVKHAERLCVRTEQDTLVVLPLALTFCFLGLLLGLTPLLPELLEFFIARISGRSE